MISPGCCDCAKGIGVGVDVVPRSSPGAGDGGRVGDYDHSKAPEIFREGTFVDRCYLYKIFRNEGCGVASAKPL